MSSIFRAFDKSDFLLRPPNEGPATPAAAEGGVGPRPTPGLVLMWMGGLGALGVLSALVEAAAAVALDLLEAGFSAEELMPRFLP